MVLNKIFEKAFFLVAECCQAVYNLIVPNPNLTKKLNKKFPLLSKMSGKCFKGLYCIRLSSQIFSHRKVKFRPELVTYFQVISVLQLFLAESGFLGCFLPKRYGGLLQLSIV